MAHITYPTSLTGNPVSPIWAGDYFSREHLLPGGVMLSLAAFIAGGAAQVTLNGAVAAGATALTVVATTLPVARRTV